MLLPSIFGESLLDGFFDHPLPRMKRRTAAEYTSGGSGMPVPAAGVSM